MSTTATTFTASPRTALGTKNAKKQRSLGQVPVTVSRAGQPSRHLSLDVKSAHVLADTVVHLCQIQVDGASFTALRGEVAWDCLTDAIKHIDLLEVDPKGEIEVEVAIAVDARNCPGVKVGGLVEQRLRKVRIQVKADAIPDAIGLDLSEVQLGQIVTAGQLKLPAGAKLLTAAKTLVLSVIIPRAMKKAEEAAAPAAGAEGAAAAPAAGAEGAAAAKGDAAKPAAGAKPDAKAGDKGDAKKK